MSEGTAPPPPRATLSLVSTQPRAAGGRFGEKIEVGVQRRLSELLRRALGHDGTDTPAPAGDDVDTRLEQQGERAELLDAKHLPGRHPQGSHGNRYRRIGRSAELIRAGRARGKEAPPALDNRARRVLEGNVEKLTAEEQDEYRKVLAEVAADFEQPGRDVTAADLAEWRQDWIEEYDPQAEADALAYAAEDEAFLAGWATEWDSAPWAIPDEDVEAQQRAMVEGDRPPPVLVPDTVPTWLIEEAARHDAERAERLAERARAQRQNPEQRARDEYELYVQSQYLAAVQATNARLYSKAGEEQLDRQERPGYVGPVLDDDSLFRGKLPRKYASEELLEWFELNGRLNYQQYRAQALGRDSDRRLVAAAGKGHPMEDTVDDFDARLAAQEAELAVLDRAPALEQKARRKFSEDDVARDWRGRFASIGSTVSLPNGGGEARVVDGLGGGMIRVRKADGSEVDVAASETEVTRSAAANAAADVLIQRAGAGSRAGRVGAVGGSVGSFGSVGGTRRRRTSEAAATRATIAEQDTAPSGAPGKYPVGSRVSFTPYGRSAPEEGEVTEFDGDLYRVRRANGSSTSFSEDQLAAVQATAPVVREQQPDTRRTPREVADTLRLTEDDAPLDALMDADPKLSGRVAAAIVGGKPLPLTDAESDLIRQHVDPTVARVWFDGEREYVVRGEPAADGLPGTTHYDPGGFGGVGGAVPPPREPDARRDVPAAPAPAAEPDDRIDRSRWTGDVAPLGFDGSGTRPDGSAWGSGYDNDADPRNDPAYDQYVADLQDRLDAGLKAHGDTHTRYAHPDGTPDKYVEERAAQHEQLLDDLMARYADVPKELRSVVMAGPPGAGKGHTIKHQGSKFGMQSDDRGNPTNFATVDPDALKQELIDRGMVPDDYGVSGPETAMITHEESSYLAKRLTLRLIAEGTNIVLDGTYGGGYNSQVKKVNQLKAAGYTVRGVLIDGEVDNSLRQAGGRHKKAPTEPGGQYRGRYVPLDFVNHNRATPEDGESATFGRPHRNKSSVNLERSQDLFDLGVVYFDSVQKDERGMATMVKDTAPDAFRATSARVDGLLRRIESVTDDEQRALLRRELNAVMQQMTYLDDYDDFHGKALTTEQWLEVGGMELEAKVLDVLAAQPQPEGKSGDTAPPLPPPAPAPVPVERVPNTPAEVEVKAGGADRDRGGAEKLRTYWTTGEGGAKIAWGTDGDFTRCVAAVSEHMSPDKAKGYCNLRHREATGKYAGAKGLVTLEEYRAELGLPTVERKAEQLPNTNPEPTGVMVALYPADDVAHALALDGGEAAEELHVTLAYLGDVDEVGDVEALRKLVEQFAAETYDVDGQVSGLGRWDAGDAGDAFVALVDAPDLPDVRTDLVDELEAAGYKVRRDHGFTPHITLAYLDAQDPSPLERIDALPATFGFLSLAVGPDVYDFALTDDDGNSITPGAPTMGASTAGLSEGDAPYDEETA